jgi:hypothetical protein
MAVITAVPDAVAIPIDGSVYFASSATLDDLDLLKATRLDFDEVFTIGASGYFAGVQSLTQVTVKALELDSFVAQRPFWTLNSGGQDYSFDLTSVNVVSRTPTALQLAGSGLLYSGSDQSVGNWTLGINGNGTGIAVSFTTAETGSVPEGGNTVWLLLLAIIAVASLRLKPTQCAATA